MVAVRVIRSMVIPEHKLIHRERSGRDWLGGPGRKQFSVGEPLADDTLIEGLALRRAVLSEIHVPTV
jgi:hypothetical protein